MANDLNQCNFIGRLGADPELRYTQDGKAITSIRIAVGWKTKDKEGTEWVSVVFFGRLAEIAGEYLKKGSKIFVSGKMRTRKWQAKDGSDRYTTEIVGNEMQMLDSKSGNDEQAARRPPKKSSPQQQEPADHFDDDIPF